MAMPRARAHLGHTTLALAVAVAPAAAQRPDSTTRADTVTTLPAVRVQASLLRRAGPVVGDGVAARVSRLDEDALRRPQPRTLAEALSPGPGFASYDDLGSPFKLTLVARGFTASPVVGLPQGLTVLIDGVPVNEPDAGQVNLDLVPLPLLADAEVLAGAAPLLGPNSLGGAVNLRTREGGPGRLAVALGAGSYGRSSAEVAVHGGAGGAWRWLAGASTEGERGWRQVTGARTRSLFARLAGDRLTVLAFGATSRVETAGSLPEPVWRLRPDSNLTAGDFEDLGQLHFSLATQRVMGAGLGALSAWARAHRAERFNVNQQADPDVRGHSRSATLGVLGDWQRTHRARMGELGVRIGGGGTLNDVSVRLYAERVEAGLTTDVRSPIARLDAFLTADWHVGPVTLSAGGRYDFVRIPFRNRLRPERDTTSVYARFNPRAALHWRVADPIAVHVSLARTFRAPAVIELACADPESPCPLPFALGDDPPLAPVVATTGEVGVRWRARTFEAGAVAYRAAVRDDIFLLPYRDEEEPVGSTIDGYFANVARTRREGLEFDARATSARGHEVHASFAATRATFRTANVAIFSMREADGGDNTIEPGDRLPLVPDRTALVGGTLMLPAGVSLGLDVSHTGRRALRGDEANEEPPLPAFTVGMLRAGVARQRWEVRASVHNLLDRRYATFGTFNIDQSGGGGVERFLTPGEPRAVRVLVRWRG
jgi:iron complex outermembrane receptor protein